MCGIAGIFHYAEPDRIVNRDLLVRMTRALAHRGPDAEGFYLNGNLGFGHRRLSIVDLSATGAQPMSNEDGSCWITYNGEFYNHQEFRKRLGAKGYRFRGSSDTETLLYLLDQDGPESLADVAGIFGLAFWDGRKNTLTLARDPLGVKQVYFHDNGRRIVFASEIKALLSCPDVPREPDPEAINQYLHFHTALFERTFFKGIHQLRPGEYLQVTRYGAKLRSYWSVKDFNPSEASASEVIEELRRQLSLVVRDQLMSDVPVGSFFSGGIDSTAVAAYASQSGKRPACFGVHFVGQDVIDERPYQEAAAKALGLDLQLITMDGSSFPDDFKKLMYHQDEPVIGAAMFPMFRVSQLASRQVKVCLGGQAADEVFGGYARYALGQPSHVIRSWFSGRQGALSSSGVPSSRVGGNLSRQLTDLNTLYRLAKNIPNVLNWESRYFEHFAKVPEAQWARVFSGPEFHNRQTCRQLFRETVRRSPASDPVDKVMHWELQTYLPGLFHQDDRMSMAASLESRIPFADPRLVRFAFQINPGLKLRGGASKWILRQAVSNILPESVLNRRKVGFDTPAEQWMKERHPEFVRETLLSSHARARGFWNTRELESFLDHPNVHGSFDILWKVLSIEVWASIFLDESHSESAVERPVQVAIRTPSQELAVVMHDSSRSQRLSRLARECRELGVRGTWARGLWEIKSRTGIVGISPLVDSEQRWQGKPLKPGTRIKLPFADPTEVAYAMRPLIPVADLASLAYSASQATRGQVPCFGRWTADFGNPIDWHRDPVNEHRWPAGARWQKVLRKENQVGDIKFIWEIGRFPQAYLMARAAAFDPDSAPDLASSFYSQVLGFLEHNPRGRGAHWNSGQEIAFRIIAWQFGIHAFSKLNSMPTSLEDALAEHLFACGTHISRYIEYSRNSVYNNHLLSEALGLYVIGQILPNPSAEGWMTKGLQLLEEQADRQFYPDGAYIQQSHNYHRVAMQIYLWALAFARKNGNIPPRKWIDAMERSLDFLVCHQNAANGSLPNYGGNDGSLPLPLSGCDFSDFRPTLQALSVATRGERIYQPGPWDEMAVWLFGPGILRLPIRVPSKQSVSFPFTGYHVLRGKDTDSFCAFRCGTILDRFSQIDMLHLDVWWRGQNVLVDAGSYLFNGPEHWHNHFTRTESHNTVQIDGHDQMFHYRQFKSLYWTKAKLLRFEDSPGWVVCEGEHYGYQRHSGKCVHRRSVLFVKDDIFVVIDSITGDGVHNARLHWLAGKYPYEFDPSKSCLRLATPKGPFSVMIFDSAGTPYAGDVVSGADTPPRGWLSRYYGEKAPVPSLAVTCTGVLPITFVSVMAPGIPEVSVSGDVWTIALPERSAHFRIESGSFIEVASEGESVLELQS